MKLTVLADNNTYIDRYFLGEPAASYYIEEGGKRFLFDTGYSGVFMDNAKALGITLMRLDGVIISHSHNDHTRGLFRFFGGDRPRLYAHPAALHDVVSAGLSVGCPYGRDQLAREFELCLSKQPVELAPRLTFLGEIPRALKFEPRADIGRDADTGEPDRVVEDTALCYEGKEGLYIITGCSHAGICSILEYAKKLTGVSKIAGVIGGFHLLDMDERAESSIGYLANERIGELYPCHCTGFCVRARLNALSPVREVGVGLTVEWE